MWEETIARIAERRTNPATRIDASGSRPLLMPPVNEEAIRAAERNLGFALPSFLSALYTTVGNGGFGPGYGLVGLQGGHTSDDRSLVDWYTAVSSAEPDRVSIWPRAVVPICDWGCAIYSCVDCSTPDGRVLTYHSGELLWDAAGEHVVSLDQAFALSHEQLVDFFDDWARSIDLWSLMFEDDPTKSRVVGINPFTRKPMTFAAPSATAPTKATSMILEAQRGGTPPTPPLQSDGRVGRYAPSCARR